MSRDYHKVVGEGVAPTRVDKYLVSVLDGLTRSALKGALESLVINGRPCDEAHKIKAGDVVDIRLRDSEECLEDIVPEDILLVVIYEDSDVCVIDKVQGMVVHPALGHRHGTLVNALLYRYKESLGSPNGGEEDTIVQSGIMRPCRPYRPYIVHRLDKDTSGVIITARSDSALRYLQREFLAHSVVKEYIAIVKGVLPQIEGVIETGIERDPYSRKRFRAVPLQSLDNTRVRYSKTAYKVIATYSGYSLLRLRLYTGRTHQIRVHMRYIGTPVLGDPIYSRRDPLFPDATLMLHSRSLEITLPSHRRIRFVSPVPERILAVIHRLKGSGLPNSGDILHE